MWDRTDSLSAFFLPFADTATPLAAKLSTVAGDSGKLEHGAVKGTQREFTT
jgi:hypothetical protein